MCLIVAALRATPRYRLIVAANRDEQHTRPTQTAAWWPGQRVFGGRDLLAGGSWLAVGRGGRFAAVTNIRDPGRMTGSRSRGLLVAEFAGGTEQAGSFAARAVRDGAEFGAFNLLLYDGSALELASNRSAATRLEAGLHAYSNAPPGSTWPKTASALAGAEPLLSLAEPIEPLFALLAQRDESADGEVQRQRTHFVRGPVYGTRCSTVVLVDSAQTVTFAERTFDAGGNKVGEVREVFALEG